MLHTFTILLHHIFVDNFFNVFEMRVGVRSISLGPILDEKHDLLRTVNTHSEAATFRRVEIFIVAESLEDLRCRVDASLLNPLLKPVDKAA